MGALGDPREILPQTPSRWYLTGFLVPTDADEEQRSDPTSNDELDQAAEPAGLDDDETPEKAAARRSYYPSSMGLSVLVPAGVGELEAVVRYGDYRKVEQEEGNAPQWQRAPREEMVKVAIGSQIPGSGTVPVPNSRDVDLVWSIRGVPDGNKDGGLPKGTRSLSVFVVNRRKPAADDVRDQGYIFQAELELQCGTSFIARPNLRSLESDDWDERVADLQYRDAFEFSVGHSVATESVVKAGQCKTVRTCWLPTAEVEKVAPSKIPGVTLEMESLANLRDGQDARNLLGGFVSSYKDWIQQQSDSLDGLSAHRKETAQELLHRANLAANRIEAGIGLLGDPQCLEAFRIANKAMAAQGRRRLALQWNKSSEEITPAWRPFQLAFLLMNLDGIANPTGCDRGLVDLLFFPTGGGKTEAYLGLAAFTLVLRRLRNPGLTSAGLSVLMRYTLRLLTLDQLGRAAALICALELERQKDVEKLGEWPFEIGLWVGMAATPNRMGRKGDTDSHSARRKTIAFKNDDRKPAPIPLKECPWCGKKFTSNSFQLVPSDAEPTDLRVKCMNKRCGFSGNNNLPVLAVDEPIYRRLPCFLIATVDKFAAMPWTGEVGGFFGRVDRVNSEGFYGPCCPSAGRPLPVDHLPPPDLVIQDELHLISGPLGTMVGLYETALDELAATEVNGKRVYPKIITSTATVRRAQTQIRALFKDELGDDKPDGNFFARNLPRDAWDAPWMNRIERVVLVHRLREVMAQVGFTRFEAVSPDIDGELEMGVRRASLAREITWLSAVENRGEGVFLQFSADHVQKWVVRKDVIARGKRLLAGYEAWKGEHAGAKMKFVEAGRLLPYVLFHSFSHLLVTAVSLECGYPASSIRERIYTIPDVGYGILLYTGTSVAEGTLFGHQLDGFAFELLGVASFLGH